MDLKELKIDKEALIKHRFWIGLGVCVILLIVALIMLPNTLGSQVETEKKAFDDSKGTLSKITQVKNEHWVKAYEKADDAVKAARNRVWAEAWETQKFMMTWPHALEEKGWGTTRYLYFGDPIGTVDRTDFAQHYADQIPEVVDLVQPLTPEGTGIVQFAGGDYNAVLDLQKNLGQIPPSETIWLTQEDLWVKRELLRIVRAANDSMAWFLEGPATPPAKPAKPAAAKAASTNPTDRVFHNPIWELHLKMTRNPQGQFVVGGTIRNVSGHRQSLYNIFFRVYLKQGGDEAPFVLVPMRHKPLAAGESADLPNVQVERQTAVEGLYAVEQVLDWRTAPVKRIDAVRLGYPSSRTANRRLKPPEWIRKAEEAKAEQAASGGDTGSAPAGGGKFGGGMAGMMSGAGGQAAAQQGQEAVDRYTDTNEQVRHMPVALLVITTDDSIPDFLAAVANSTLHIQTLQYHWHHSHEHIQPQTEADSGPDKKNKTPSPTGQPPVYRGITLPSGLGGGGMAGGVAGGKFTMRSPTSGMGGMGAQMQQQMMGQRMRQAMQAGMGAGRGYPGMPGMPGGMTGKLVGGLPAGGGLPAAGEAEEEQNLVELAVYGLAALYERYPPKQETSSGDQNANGGAASK